MKRMPELRQLSVDHHHGLVLARRAKQTGQGAGDRSVEDMWAEVERAFREELDRHFDIEETYLAPPLMAAGEKSLVDRLKEEHRVLRGIIQDTSDRSTACLRRFGDLLEQHIRFEERELFETAQKKLAPESLQAVAEATHSAS